ncbi:MAG: HK97 gp10 family phage protein [Gammaproteobacteria bacterium]|nr:HK97 gp10 family phage protein [Gammaproteobacteria bacterium]
MSKFTAQIEAFNEKLLKKVALVRKDVAVQLFTDIIEDTPVDTGRAKGNWYASLNAPIRAIGVHDSLSAVAKMNYGTDEDIYLTNNLPYIVRLEYGYSKKSPQGMVRKNVARFEQIFKEALMKIK